MSDDDSRRLFLFMIGGFLCLCFSVYVSVVCVCVCLSFCVSACLRLCLYLCLCLDPLGVCHRRSLSLDCGLSLSLPVSLFLSSITRCPFPLVFILPRLLSASVSLSLSPIKSRPLCRFSSVYLSVNMGFAFAELVVGYVNNSLGLLADSGHMFFDCLALLAGVMASVVARWGKTARFT